ncbi:MAG: nitroreductase family protein [Candidatus Aenigmatarchaeota archaeon]|nr:nitroreductase family protein [Candidatus Aenigmarchaeota archaeon]
METIECIKTRKSVRKFKKKDIEKEKLIKILEAAINAPSSGNLQNWEFIIVRDEENKKHVAKAALNQNFIADASVVIIACSNNDKIIFYGKRGRDLYAIENVSAAIQNILLAANDLGIGSCWVGAFDEKELKKILEIPENVRPLAIIPLGYPDENPEKPVRRSLSQVVFEEKYGKKLKIF